MQDKPLKNIVVVGSGVEAFSTALLLHNQLFPRISVTLIDLGGVSSELSGQSMMPLANRLHASMGLSEKEFLSECDASFRLGTTYVNWSEAGQRVFSVPFSDHGFLLEGIEFHQYFSGLAIDPRAVPFNQFSLSALAMQNGFFRHPVAEANSLLNQLIYGYHSYEPSYLTALKKRCNNSALRVVESSVSECVFDGVNLISVNTIEGNVEADIFIDASADKKILSGHRHYSVSAEPFNSVVSFSADQQSFNAETRCAAIESGILIKVPTPSKDVYQLHFDSNQVSEDQIITELKKLIPGFLAFEIQPYTSYRAREPWEGNVIALGRSAFNQAPLFVSNIDVLYLSLSALLDIFPASLQYQKERDEYNRLVSAQAESIEDFHNLLLCSTSTGYYSDFRVSDRVKWRLGVYHATGSLPLLEDQVASDGNWVSVLINTGQVPDTFSPLVEAVDPRWVSEQLQKMSAMMASAAPTLPYHTDYLKAVISAK